MTLKEGIREFRVCHQGRRFRHAGFLLSLQPQDMEPPHLEGCLSLSISPSTPQVSGKYVREVSVIYLSTPNSFRYQETARPELRSLS